MAKNNCNNFNLPASVANGGLGVATITGALLGSGTANITGVTYTAVTSFTPVLNFASSPTGITYSVQQGTYTRVGNLVTFTLNIALTNKGTFSASDSPTITGFPFSAANTCIFVGAFNEVTSNGQLTARLPSSNTMSIDDVLFSNGARNLARYDQFTNTSSFVISGSYNI